MCKKPTLIVLLLSWSFGLYAQNGEVTSAINTLSQSLKEVVTGKSTFNQSVSNPEPGVVLYTQEKITSKGSSQETFTFNLADIDEYTVKSKTSRDVIMVNFSITNKQKLVAATADGESKGYVSEVDMLASDIDNAREMVDLIKSAIKPARAIIEKRLSLNGYDNQVNWLIQHIGSAAFNDKKYEQVFKKGEYPGSFILTRTESTSKGAKTSSFSFNLSDADAPTVNFDISRDELSVGFETKRDLKVIKQSEDGAAKPFLDKLNFYTQTVEEARDLRQVIIWAIEGAAKQTENVLATYSSSKGAIQDVGKYLLEVDYGDEKVTQQISGDCTSTISIESADTRGTKTNEYKFDFLDFNKELTKYEVARTKMTIELVAKNKVRLVQVSEGGAFKTYDDVFKVHVPDIEVAKRLENALKQATEWCEKEYVTPYKKAGKDPHGWLLGAVKDVSKNEVTFQQSLEQVDNGNTNKLKFTKREVDEKNSKEEIFEFNLSDLNEKSVEFNINNNKLEVIVKTNYDEDLIKYYKNGEVGNYENKMSFVFDDLPTARGAKSALSELITKAKK